MTIQPGKAQTLKVLRLTVWGLAAALWLTPLIAMQFTREVQWGPLSFVMFAGLLAGAAGIFDLLTRTSSHPAYIVAGALSLGAACLMVWANLAVGIIGAEDNPANLIVFGIALIGLIGAAISRLKARGLALTLLIMALAQTLTAVATATIFDAGPPTALLCGGFAGVWLVSAGLFYIAGRPSGHHVA
ncbi:MAG: hypothetical protein QM667_14235 [Asticcacaulis sp.]